LKKGIGLLAIVATLVLAIGWPSFRPLVVKKIDLARAEEEALTTFPPMEVRADPASPLSGQTGIVEARMDLAEIKGPLVTLIGEIIPVESEENP
jgi:hypothetical protein